MSNDLFEENGGTVTATATRNIKSVPDMSGCLSKYAKHPTEPLSEVRKKVWGEVVHGKAR